MAASNNKIGNDNKYSNAEYKTIAIRKIKLEHAKEQSLWDKATIAQLEAAIKKLEEGPELDRLIREW